jgi:hypothetical protein
MNPALRFSRLRSPPNVEHRASGPDKRSRVEPSPKLRMNPARGFSRLRSRSSVERRASAPHKRCPPEPWPKLRMNPALRSSGRLGGHFSNSAQFGRSRWIGARDPPRTRRSRSPSRRGARALLGFARKARAVGDQTNPMGICND